jgi:hypothetical protein
MVDQDTESVDVGTAEDTEVKTTREPAELSIRQSLKQQLSIKDDEDTAPVSEKEETDSGEDLAEVAPAMVPPADMNAAEKAAFLNPTPANAHILQAYLNRRAYETRSDYGRKMQEVEQLKRQTQSLYQTIQQYEDEYAKDGISIADVARRSIAWDKAMQQSPVETALDWLDSYGLRVEDLVQQYQQQPQQSEQYLTREEAERLAEDRWRSLQAEQEKKAFEYVNQRIVESFVASKPLFRDPETASQLEAEMAPVVQALNATGRYSSPEQVLETAYNYVVNGNPTFSGLAQKMAARQGIQQQQQAVQKAKQAAKSISGSAGSGSPRVVAKSLRDNLQRRFGGE